MNFDKLKQTLILPSWAAVFFLTVFSLFLPIYFGTKNFIFFDRSTVLDGAWRILLGQVPYRDFSIYFGPLLFYLQALFFKMFGITLFSGVLHAAVMNSVATLLTFWGVRRFLGVSTGSAWAAAVLTAFWFYTPISWPWFEQTGYLLLMASFLMAWTGNPISLAFSGGLCALTVLCKADIAIVSTCAMLGLLYFFHPPSGDNFKKNLFLFLGGYFFVLGLWLIFLLGTGSLHGAWFNLVVRPSQLGRFHRLLDLPRNLFLRPALIVLFLGTFFGVTLFLKQPLSKNRPAYGLLIILSLAQIFCRQLSSVVSHAHLVFLGWMWLILKEGFKERRILMGILWCFFVYGGWKVSSERLALYDSHPAFHQEFAMISAPEFKHIQIQKGFAEDLEELLTWGQKELRPEDRVLVLPSMSVLYFVWKKEPPHPFLFLDAGYSISRRLGDEEVLIHSIQSHKPKWLILESKKQVSDVSLEELFDYFPRFYDYLRQVYVPTQSLSGYSILKWKGDP